MKNWLIFLFLITTLAAKSQRLISIPAPQGDSFIESERIEEVTFFPLEQERIGMIAPDMELRYFGGHYFILDNRFTQCVYRYDGNGELLNTICEGQESKEADLPELKNPANFNINPFDEQVEIYNFQKSIVQRFSFDGTKIDQIPFPFNPADYIRDTNGYYWIYTGWNNRESQYRLIITDKNGKVVDRKLRLVTRCVPIEGFSFSVNGDEILLWELLGNLTYSIKGNALKERYLLFYGPYNLPQNFHIIEAAESYHHMNTTGYYSLKKYLENNDFAYFFLNFTNTAALKREMLHIIHDKRADKIHIYTENAAIGAFDKAQALTENNELVFLVSPRKIRQLFGGGTEFVPAPFYELVDAIADIRYTMVIKIKLQSEEE